MKTNETIEETYKRIICNNCSNKKTNLCEIRRNINGNLHCCYYSKEKEIKGYKDFKGRTAYQNKPIMKI